MSATIVESNANSVTIQITIPFEGSMLASEESIQTHLNAAGVLASGKALEQFDTDGSPLAVGGVVYTSKGRAPKSYQSPYGKVSIARHVYQSSEGGATFCPLEVDGRIILTSTPRFAKQISHKYAEMSGPRVVNDLERWRSQWSHCPKRKLNLSAPSREQSARVIALSPADPLLVAEL